MSRVISEVKQMERHNLLIMRSFYTHCAMGAKQGKTSVSTPKYSHTIRRNHAMSTRPENKGATVFARGPDRPI